MDMSLLRKMRGLEEDAEIPNNMPQQRYIDIIAEGCTHFGVQLEHIAWLREQPCRPRSSPEEYAVFDVPAGTPTMTAKDVSCGDALGEHPLYRVVNGKVLEYQRPQFEGCRQHGRHVVYPCKNAI